MKHKNIALLVCSFSIFLPILTIQLYLLNVQTLPNLLILSFIFIVIIGALFLHGIRIKRWVYVISLPLVIITFFIFLKIVNYQDKLNTNTADYLIVLIEKYKSENKQYPTSLAQLRGRYVKSIPKIWLGLVPVEYIYYFDKKNKSFSLTKRFGKYEGNTWQSSLGSWDYYGD
jgi:energy-coupling factor transporter transmembrane protein EcfT